MSMDLRKQPGAFMTSYHRTRELFGAALYGGAIKAATTAQFKGKTFDITTADGQPLFSAAHPAKVSGPAQCNLFKDAFSVDALGQMETAMQIFCGDTEEILDVSPDTILIPDLASLKKDVFAAIGADKDNIERIYGDSFLDITDLNKLPVKLAGIIKRYIR